MAEVRVTSASEVPEGEVRGFDVEGTAVAVANVGGGMQAFHNECTHKRCTLDDGDVEEGAIVCACHGSAFDLRSGEVRNPPATEGIAVYPVRVDGDDVYVDLG